MVGSRRGRGLADDAVVVRGGIMMTSTLAVAAQASAQAGKRYCPSFWSHPDHDAARIVADARTLSGAHLPHSQIRVSTARRLRTAGFRPIRRGAPGHYDIVIPTPVDDATWQALQAAFDPPQPMPVGA